MCWRKHGLSGFERCGLALALETLGELERRIPFPADGTEPTMAHRRDVRLGGCPILLPREFCRCLQPLYRAPQAADEPGGKIGGDRAAGRARSGERRQTAHRARSW